MKIELFVAREIQYLEIGIFAFNLCVYYLPRGFIASTRAFNLLTRVFNCIVLYVLYVFYFDLAKA